MAKANATKAAQTGRERAAAAMLADRIARARAKNPPCDPSGEHHAAIAEIARRAGKDVVDLLDEWDERAAIRQYDGCASRAEAERMAVVDIEALYVPAQGYLL